MNTQGDGATTMTDYTEELLKELRTEHKSLREDMELLKGEMIRLSATISAGKQIVGFLVLVQLGLGVMNALQGRSEIIIQKPAAIEQKVK